MGIPVRGPKDLPMRDTGVAARAQRLAGVGAMMPRPRRPS